MRRLSLPELRRLGAERWTAGSTPVLAQLPTIPTFQELRPALEGELRRSRRYERPLAVLVVVPDLGPPLAGAGHFTGDGTGNGRGHGNGNGSNAPNGNGAHHANGSGNGRTAHSAGSDIANGVLRPLYWAQLRFLMLGSLLCGTLRESDVVSYAADVHEFVALLPECKGDAARQTVERLHQIYSSRMGTGLRAGMAVYPADGLTLDNLLEHARRALAATPIGQAILNGKGNGGAHA
jgi:hypothetical protein